uniref:Uncharacterized protein n=1 Tax=Anas zonorhyncha TaxID=75864 RepID=A0A8B9VBY5_9AVES
FCQKGWGGIKDPGHMENASQHCCPSSAALPPCPLPASILLRHLSALPPFFSPNIPYLASYSSFPNSHSPPQIY